MNRTTIPAALATTLLTSDMASALPLSTTDMVRARTEADSHGGPVKGR
jgi:hypothetical protein